MKKKFYEELFDREKKPVIGMDITGIIIYMNPSAKDFYHCQQKENEFLTAENIFENFNVDKILESVSSKNFTVNLFLKNNPTNLTYGLFNIPQSNKKNLLFLIAAEPSLCTHADIFDNNVFTAFFENPLYGVILFYPASFKIIKYNTAAQRMFQIKPKKQLSIRELFEGEEQSHSTFSELLDDVLSGRMLMPQPSCIELKRDKNHSLRILVNLNILEQEAEKIGILTISDITFQKTEELRISQAEDRYRNLIELSPEGVIVLINNYIVYSNLSGVKILGGNSVIDIIHLNILNYFSPADRRILKHEFSDILQNNIIGSKREITIKRLDGNKIIVNLSAVPVYYENQKAVQIILKDITERKKIEAEREMLILELEEANRKLKELGVLKEKFLAVASHDLRSPFTAILGFSQILMNDNTIKTQNREYAERIYKSAKTQLRYINDLLQTIKLEYDDVKLNKSLININDIISESVDILSILAEKKNVKIDTLFTFDIPVYLDRDKISQVINNLLSNAIKFTPRNGSILIETGSNEPDNFYMRFKDEGVGIAEKNLKILFDKYYKISTSGTEGESGTGLGLAITKNLIELHKGSITVKSKINKGSTFTITLPIEKSASF